VGVKMRGPCEQGLKHLAGFLRVATEELLGLGKPLPGVLLLDESAR
jgi:hypothetical protein